MQDAKPTFEACLIKQVGLEASEAKATLALLDEGNIVMFQSGPTGRMHFVDSIPMLEEEPQRNLLPTRQRGQEPAR